MTHDSRLTTHDSRLKTHDSMTQDSRLMTPDSRPVWRSYLTHLECTACGLRHDADQLQTVCTGCSKVLFARYDLNSIRQAVITREVGILVWAMWRSTDCRRLV